MTDIIRKFAEYAVPSQNSVWQEGMLRVTSLGITSLLFDDGKTKILFDAMVTRPSLLKSFFGKIGSDERLVRHLVRKHRMKGMKAIFVSHTHYDHVLDVPAFSKETGADVYASRSGVNVALGSGIAMEKLHTYSGGETYRIGDFTIRVLPSIHSPATVLNNDLGVEIERPLSLPTKKKNFTEGGSYDFYIEHGDKKILIRPSCNYIKDSLAEIEADVLFLGVARLSKFSDEERETFYRETVGTVHPKTVVPVHWDNFFKPVTKGNEALYAWMDDIPGAMEYMIRKLERDGVLFRIIPFGGKICI